MNLLILLLVLQNPFCKGPDYDFNLMPGSDAIDTGTFTELHCPFEGPDVNNTGCIVWYKLPDIGACEFIPDILPLSGELVAVLK